MISKKNRQMIHFTMLAFILVILSCFRGFSPLSDWLAVVYWTAYILIDYRSVDNPGIFKTRKHNLLFNLLVLVLLLLVVLYVN
ncbi:hypothetical protein NRIC_30630 [Enterococcus florum]|uniref:Lipoprotein n=1 Tax=Enterococcus florum TaxID=2480627 RepID=A0A4P5PHP7_9ENTE|nr:hypothetical protein [Enterococcus florum]GCF95172.1 hypothetical protein NRIC_30630 [Enterococcus florum]